MAVILIEKFSHLKNCPGGNLCATWHGDNEQGPVVCCPSEMNGAAHSRSKWPEGCLHPALQMAQGQSTWDPCEFVMLRPCALAQPWVRLPPGWIFSTNSLSCSQVTIGMGRTTVQCFLWQESRAGETQLTGTVTERLSCWRPTGHSTRSPRLQVAYTQQALLGHRHNYSYFSCLKARRPPLLFSSVDPGALEQTSHEPESCCHYPRNQFKKCGIITRSAFHKGKSSPLLTTSLSTTYNGGK